MPTKEAIKDVLFKVGAVPGGKKTLQWTSLREEPVIYINGKPYVLRLFQDPMKNLEATGIARERVELMEERMKQDVLAELIRYNGRFLLHDEEGDMNNYSIIVGLLFIKANMGTCFAGKCIDPTGLEQIYSTGRI